MNLSRRARSAFTLIELLVVIAIIAILIGLLVPAVQKVREAAARAQCSNQLKQLGLACHGYHDTAKALPQNYCLLTNGGYGLYTADWSWIAFILPYIEQSPLYTAGRIGARNNGFPSTFMSNVASVVSTPISLLRCPSDPDYGTTNWGDRADIGGAAQVAITNYKGVAGSNWGWGNGRWNPGWVTSGTGSDQNGLDNGNGVLWRSNGTFRKKYSFVAITDGTSNTFMIGESLPSKSLWTGAWAYANNATGTCAIYPNATQSNGQLYATWDWPDNYSFHSAHTGGLNFAMCDGSVRFISESIDIGLYRALATRSGGEAVSVPE